MGSVKKEEEACNRSPPGEGRREGLCLRHGKGKKRVRSKQQARGKEVRISHCEEERRSSLPKKKGCGTTGEGRTVLVLDQELGGGREWFNLNSPSYRMIQDSRKGSLRFLRKRRGSSSCVGKGVLPRDSHRKRSLTRKGGQCVPLAGGGKGAGEGKGEKTPHHAKKKEKRRGLSQAEITNQTP